MTVDEFRHSIPIANHCSYGTMGADIEAERLARREQWKRVARLGDLRSFTHNDNSLTYWFWRMSKDLNMTWNDCLVYCIEEMYLRIGECHGYITN